MRRVLIGLAASSALSGCVAVDRQACAAGEQSAVSDVLYFGMAKPTGGIVTHEEWAAFLSAVVTPRFPAGLTAWPASGQWHGADGQIVREDSYVLNLFHPAEASAEREIQTLIAEYKKRFQQEAVLRVRSSVCTSL